MSEPWDALLEFSGTPPLLARSVVLSRSPWVKMFWNAYKTPGGGAKLEFGYVGGPAAGVEIADALEELQRGVVGEVVSVMRRGYTLQSWEVSDMVTRSGADYLRVKSSVTVSEGAWLDPVLQMLERFKTGAEKT